ncbi:MAG: c-type cytochrome [Campylobacterales bacterium]|nr:c-type cytochrome [Campylobacterales bacterium]
MKKTTSVLLSSVVALGMLSTAANADVSKGQKVYLKMCKKCHGNGTKGAAMNTQDGWDELFENNGAKLIKAHEGDSSEAFFKGDMFQKISGDLRDFLYEYGSDSGNVPSC